MKVVLKNGSTIEGVEYQDVTRGKMADSHLKFDGNGFSWKINTKANESEKMTFVDYDSQGFKSE